MYNTLQHWHKKQIQSSRLMTNVKSDKISSLQYGKKITLPKPYTGTIVANN